MFNLLNFASVDIDAFAAILDKARQAHNFLKSLMEIAAENKQTHTYTLISQADAATILGKTPAFLGVLRHRGSGPNFYKIGGTISYDINDVLNYLESCRHTPTTTTMCEMCVFIPQKPKPTRS
ncbi:MAG: hypothetical protein WCG04_04545 [Alphaproteobacteria bacterium]